MNDVMMMYTKEIMLDSCPKRLQGAELTVLVVIYVQVF